MNPIPDPDFEPEFFDDRFDELEIESLDDFYETPFAQSGEHD